MIARLEGTLAEKTPESVVLDVRGVGYEVRVPLSTFLALPLEGKTVQLRIHTLVREDALQLYGFLTETERRAFLLLLGINKVGPRMALAILSGLPPAELAAAVRERNAAAFRGVPGVGPKTGERILIELRDKVAVLEETRPESAVTDIEEETLSALANLGYPPAQAERAVRRAVKNLPEDPTLEELVREALRVAAG